MSKQTTFFFFLGFLFIAANLQADCRGCCSRHKGVVCVEAVTLCGDGSRLSRECKAKQCGKCNGETKYEPESQSSEYNRKDWPHWIDEDGDCQNTRAEILIRDNIGTIKFKRNKPCNVSWGKWKCPYTGKTFAKASDLDIDHIVPLAHAHRTGAANWTRAKKRQFANDPLNLLAVEDNANQAKGDKAPDEWEPPLKSYWKTYAKKWRAVKKKYGLNISTQEEKALHLMSH